MKTYLSFSGAFSQGILSILVFLYIEEFAHNTLKENQFATAFQHIQHRDASACL